MSEYVFELPSRPGTYALVLQCRVRRAVPIGRLGTLHLCPGTYVYVGSAFGPGGLRARVGRHQRRAGKALRWHIDHLRPHLELTGVWYAEDRLEHAWALDLASRPGARIPLLGFGASDCRCRAHLIALSDPGGAR